MTNSFRRLALAAVLALPSAALAQTRAGAPPATTTGRPAAASPAPATDGGLRVGGLIGLEFGDATGLALRLDGEMPVTKVAPSIDVSGVLSLGYTRFSDDAFGVDVTTNIVKVIPAIRFTMANIAPQLGVYGDAGLGLYYHSTSVSQTFFGQDLSDSGIGFTLRLGAGAFYDVSDKLRIAAELGVNPYFGDVDDTTFSVLAGITFRL